MGFTTTRFACLTIAALTVGIAYSAAQEAAFSYQLETSSSCVPPMQLFLFDQSTGPVNSRQWTVHTDPPMTSNVQNPSFVILADQSFQVTLVVDGQDTAQQQIEAYSDPVAEFKSDIRQICPGQTVQFSDLSLGENFIYTWDFGDGTGIASVQDPAYHFPTSGQFNVSLTVIDTISGCTDSEVKPKYIAAIGFVSDFTGSFPRDTSCSPLTVTFETIPPGDFDAVTWYTEANRGFDSPVYVDENPVEHTYTAPGPDPAGYYDVAVVVEHEGCRDSIYKNDYIRVQGLEGGFEFVPDSVHTGDTVWFYPVGVTLTDSIEWDFGVGMTAVYGAGTDSIPVIYDSAGVYTPSVTLYGFPCDPLILSPGNELVVSEAPVPVSLIEQISPQKIRIFPNPAGESAAIHTGESGPFDIEIYDASGRLVHADRMVGTSYILDRAVTGPGIFTVRLLDNGKAAFGRIVFLH